MSAFRTSAIILLMALVLAGAAAGGAFAQSGDGTINVNGRVTYVDENGTIKPAAGVRVAVLDWDYRPTEGPSETLGEVITDSDGFFSVSDIDNRDLEGSPRRWDRTGQDVFIEVRTDSPEIRLLNTRTLQPFVWSSFDKPGGFFRDAPDGRNITVNLPIQVGDRQVKGMEVYQTMRAGWNFLSQPPDLDGPIVAQWGDNSLDGPYYVPGQRIFYDASAAIYPHVILHHFAHALAWEIQGDAGYPADCFPAQDDHTFDLTSESTAECAWTEGWAVGFSMIVLGDPGYRTSAGLIDMEAPDADTPDWDDGDTVAGRVAGALWDLYDDVDDGLDTHTPVGDTAQERFAPVWDAYVAGEPSTTEAFWEAYLAGGANACSAVRAFFQNTIDYNDAPDAQTLPDITVEEDSSADDVVDLWAFVTDTECPDDQLTYTFIEEVPPEFGITIEDNRWIDVNPAPDWFGSIRVGIEISDGLERARRYFTLTIGAVNDAPRLGEIPQFEALINTPIEVDLEPYVDDVDNLQSDLSVGVQFLDRATVEVDGLHLTFTPDADYEGTQTPRIRVEDGAGGVAETDLVLIWSRSPNRQPQIVGLPAVFRQNIGVAIVIDFTEYGQDTEDPPSALKWVVQSVDSEDVSAQPGTGPDGDRVWVFTPKPGFKGSVVVQVVVADTRGGRSEPAEVRLLWTPPTNQPPLLLKEVGDRKAFIGQPLALDLRGYATDPDGNDAALIWFPNKATVDCCQVSLTERQRLIFFPLPGWGTQSDEVELVVRDSLGAEVRTQVLLTWELFTVYMPVVGRNILGP